jgi:hypothetical protein
MPKKFSLALTIPFTPKWFLKRRIKGLEQKITAAKDKFCDLSDKVEEEKQNAAKLLVKKEYDNVTDKLDNTLQEACECAKGAAEEPEGAGKPASSRKDCVKKLFPTRFPKGRTGAAKLTDEEKEKIRKCQEKGV